MIQPWLTYADLPAPLPTLPGGEAEWGAVITLASEVLWALSGRRWAGETTRTVEVVAPAAGSDLPLGWDSTWGTVMHPHIVDGQITNHSCCPAPQRVRLPGSPARVLSVTENGTARPEGSYRLDGGYLLDLTGSGWPTCGRGVLVTYVTGRKPPEAGKVAAGILARELGRARAGDPACGLPANVTSQTRQGISQTFVPASQIIALGQTGLMPVDTWLATVNPAKLTRRARAWSPDTSPRTHRRTP